jgi:octaprenyl-diphosphate synthase
MQTEGVPRRTEPVGLHAGAPLSRIKERTAVSGVFALLAPELLLAEKRLVELVGSRVEVVAEVGRYLVDAGGKRLRPLLTGLSGRAIGFDGELTDLMCVGELIHLGSLLHDDVVDDGLLRRGKSATHLVYGRSAAILVGDFCMARAIYLAGEIGGQQASTELGAAITAMAEGEVLQLLRAGNLDTSLEHYLEMIDKKSAALIAWCAAAPAWASGDARLAQALADFGRQVGVAFQITDDVLDYAPQTGKTPGQDVRERKLTLPLVQAMARIPSLRLRLEQEPLNLEETLQEIRACGALEAALQEARERVELAKGALSILPESPYKAALLQLAHYLVERVY